MLKFGKKINYRPLIVSLLTSLIIGLLFGLNIDALLGLQVGIIMFLIMFLGHYLIVLPVIFNYWYLDQNKIRYSNIKSIHTRLLMLFFPKMLHLDTIKKNRISSITILGLPQPDINLNSEFVISEEGGFLYNLLLMINEPVKIRILTTDNKTVDLDLSRDFVKHPQETIAKINLFLKQFRTSILHISNTTKKYLNE